MTSLPVWKAQLLERKRKDEEEGKRKEKEEVERLANIPGWMKEVMERRRNRLGSRPWHSEGHQAGGGRCEPRRADNLEPEGAVVRETIGPVKRNPFVRQEKQRRGPGSGEGQRSRPEVSESMGVRTIRAEGVTIREGLEIRRPPPAGPSRQPTPEAALTRSVEDLSSWGMGEDERDGKGEEEGEVRRGRVRRLLSRFGQRRGFVARSHSTENVPRRPPSRPKVPGSTPRPPSPPRAGNEGGTLLLLGNNRAPAHARPPLPRDPEIPRPLSPPRVGKKGGALPILEDPRAPIRANPPLPRDPETPLPPSSPQVGSEGQTHPALEDTRVPVRANPPLPRDPKTLRPLSPPWVGHENGLLPTLGDTRVPVRTHPPLPRDVETPLGNDGETLPTLEDTRVPVLANPSLPREPETARPLSPPQVGNKGRTLSPLGDARVPAQAHPLLPRDQEAPRAIPPPWVDNEGGAIPKLGDPNVPALANPPLPRDGKTPLLPSSPWVGNEDETLPTLEDTRVPVLANPPLPREPETGRPLSPPQVGNEGGTLPKLGDPRAPAHAHLPLPRDQETPRALSPSPPQDGGPRRWPRAMAGEGEQGARAEGPGCEHGSLPGPGSLWRPQAEGDASASPSPSPSEPPPPPCSRAPLAAPHAAGHEPRDRERERAGGEELDPSRGLDPSMNRLHRGAASPPQRKAGRTITINPRRAAENGLAAAPLLTQPPPTTTAAAAAITPGKKRYPTAEQILVIGGYLSLRRSCLVKTGSSRRKLNISFNDGELESTFEYPSELALLAEFGAEEEEVSSPQAREPEEEEEEEEAPIPRLEVPGSPLVGRAIRRKPLLVDENCR
ncbi:phostensin isoform X6 [Amblyraja radiata]|uniref:phostensin isoform X6 n=1 Tax=Amblyraja radiata TaxID=386614 RepID=UPI001401BE32|nr:phostensin isoform X6 [Amblyraja radiata]